MGTSAALRRTSLAILAALVAVAGLCAFSYAAKPERAEIRFATDRILVEKAARRMTLYSEGRAIRIYRVALGRGGPAAKEQAGDGRVPEGVYSITGRNPESAYHLSLRIGYPRPDQLLRAAELGIDPGGDIMIHGLPNGLGWVGGEHRRRDWTEGCIALTNEEIEEVWRLVPDGTEIEIRP